jgi:hypothetical protein
MSSLWKINPVSKQDLLDCVLKQTEDTFTSRTTLEEG